MSTVAPRTRRLNPFDRAERNKRITAARCDGQSWATIEHRYGVSARQARRIVKDVGGSIPALDAALDPVEIVTSAVMHREELISQLAEIADTASDPLVAIKAVEAQVRAANGIIAVLRDVGHLPTPLSRVGQQADAVHAAATAVAVLNRHGIPNDIKAELVAALQVA